MNRLVLKDSHNTVVREFWVETDEVSVVHLFHEGRVTLVSDLKDLENRSVPHVKLADLKTNKLLKDGFALPEGYTIIGDQDHQKGQMAFRAYKEGPEEDPKQEKMIYKWTAGLHGGLILVILLVGLVIEPYFFKKPEQPPVMVTVQELKISPSPTVRPAFKPLPPTTRRANAARTNKVTKRVTTKMSKRTSQAKRVPRPERAVDVNKMGALAALGGRSSGVTSAAGHDAKSASRAAGWKGVGSKGQPGGLRSLTGQGLVAGDSGTQSQIVTGGGYQTEGRAGKGQAGYGRHQTSGSASSYFEPLTEEAFVQGGLDRDQIAAVIQRHIGQVISCYEQGLQSKPGLAGRVSVEFVISRSGQVGTAFVNGSSLQSPFVEGCIVQRLQTWRFPKPVGGVQVKVTYPFVLRRISQG